MTFRLDPDELIRAGRTAEDDAARLREAGALIDFGPTEVDDAAALARLQRRVHRLASRIGSNGRSLQAFAREAEAVDSQVSFTFLVLSGTRWR
ncbi:hypothetical protein SFC88_03465 [Nocardioides sp. HM23]|uniref:hypothetical protein n=1 Tax=Nocardioides bizhenqiangii TaxID=3095076 RepID=UPI002ACAC222|nr:hypothetical protein [Nocardioides sp. HM23]MDZ5619867.1 hypothetical protein [Nocardioides sp. HM23]